ncbi:G patch domain-containing protein 4 [Plutella xylostella]|uniref:G patch domain-containing protein 4 n=1 Tax=Plutella xylostella TaxID=51655 RepID=UPI002032C9F3|nr:G patch domain-containing protein 4 [Plutella xylostella]
MNFARKQLEKYGWSDGKGLGKHENGISEALKPKLKRSVTGVGHDAAKDFTEHWWTTLYDKAAGNVQVEDKNGKTKKIKTKDEFEITNSTWKLKRKKKEVEGEQYANFFVKKAILASGGVKTTKVDEADSSDDDDDEKDSKDVFKMTDEELFAACEGRTAHKGARHGLRATGKLARIAQQEQELLNQQRFEGYSHYKKAKTEGGEPKNMSVDDQAGKKKNNENYELPDACNTQSSEESLPKIYDQRGKKKRKKNNENCELPDACNTQSSEDSQTKIKKKKRKNKDVEDETVVDRAPEVAGNEEVASKKRKKKKKDKQVESGDVDS